jgi:large subunit ribosomal protein L35
LDGRRKRKAMPKLKTHRGAAKRLKVTATGKVRRRKAFKSHLLTGKGADRRRRLRRGDLVHPSNVRRVRRLIPYM